MAPLWDIRLWNLGDLDFDLSGSLKVKYNDAVGLSIHEFLLMYNSNHMSISHLLGDICTWKCSPYLLLFGKNNYKDWPQVGLAQNGSNTFTPTPTYKNLFIDQAIELDKPYSSRYETENLSKRL